MYWITDSDTRPGVGWGVERLSDRTTRTHTHTHTHRLTETNRTHVPDPQFVAWAH